jgi:hypothetical protein
MERFAIELHNAVVRRLTLDGESHHMYPDAWSETRTVEIEAEGPGQALEKVEQTYPRARGFIIENIRHQ